MKVLLSELDGTTWEQELPECMLSPELHAPLFCPIFDMRGEFDLTQPTFKIRRYKRIGISGDIAFYDRVVDAEEIR